MGLNKNMIAVFYDSCMFSPAMSQEPNVEHLKYLLNDSVNFVTDTVLDEIKKGKDIRKDDIFNLILKNNNDLRSYFHLVRTKNCRKQEQIKAKIYREMYIKQTPLSCSAYHVWLPSAINPAIETSEFRHVFNDCLYGIVNVQDKSAVRYLENLISRYNNLEIRHSNETAKCQEDGETQPNILTSRAKRKRAFLSGEYRLADYQMVTSAIIWACLHKVNTFVVTCDKDIVDIKNNLFDSFVDRCTINAVISNLFVDAEEYQRARMLKEKTTISKQEINEAFQDISKSLSKPSKNEVIFGIDLYNTTTQMSNYYMERIPTWLLEFILNYKKNQLCFSLNEREFMQYPVYYDWLSDPFSDKFTCKIGIRSPMDCPPGFYPDCGSKCIYEYNEQNAPHLLSDFRLEW